jgi:hypothetical protein
MADGDQNTHFLCGKANNSQRYNETSGSPTKFCILQIFLRIIGGEMDNLDGTISCGDFFFEFFLKNSIIYKRRCENVGVGPFRVPYPLLLLQDRWEESAF